MLHDDPVYLLRLQAMSAAQQLGSVQLACRMLDIPRSTFYRWRRQWLQYGPEMLRPRERREPRMPNATLPFVEEQVVAFALAHPGFGPRRISDELRREKWGSLSISPNGVWRVLQRHGLNTRDRRLRLVAGYAAPPTPTRPQPQPERHLKVEHPGDIVQMDCFCIGRLSGTKGTVWQYTATDVFSAYTWAFLRSTTKNPLARYTSALAHSVAQDLAARGWRLKKVMTDNGSEFRSTEFTQTVQDLGAKHVFIHAGRPQTNGCVERAQQTLLEECWKPGFARYLVPKSTGLARDLEQYLRYYNTDRAHHGRWTRGRTPEEVIGKPKMWPA
jgi:transposase InsO family protein